MFLHFLRVKHTMLQQLVGMSMRVCVHWLDGVGLVFTFIRRRVWPIGYCLSQVGFLFD